MPKAVALFVAFSLAPLVFGEDIELDRTRPLLALTSTLQQRYGLLVTYEDAPRTRPVSSAASFVRAESRIFSRCGGPLRFECRHTCRIVTTH